MGLGFDPRGYDLKAVIKQREQEKLLNAGAQAGASIQAWQESQTLCWYCGQRPPDTSMELLKSARLYSRTSEVTDFGASKSVRTAYTEVEISIPRCAQCRLRHSGLWKNYIEYPMGLPEAVFTLLGALLIGVAIVLTFTDQPAGDSQATQIQVRLLSGALGVLCLGAARFFSWRSSQKPEMAAVRERRRAAEPVVKHRPIEWPVALDGWKYVADKEFPVDLVTMLLADARASQPVAAEKLIAALDRSEVKRDPAAREKVARALADLGSPAMALIHASYERSKNDKRFRAGLDQAVELISQKSGLPSGHSPDGRRIAYSAKIGDKWMVVVDGVEGKPYDGLMKDSLTFSPDSRRIAFGAKVGERWTVVVDGIDGRPYDGLSEKPLAFSPDSRRVAVGAKVGGKWVVVVDGVEGKLYDGTATGWLTFSPDSRRIAFGAKTREEWSVVVDGVEGKLYDGLSAVPPVFSPDSRRIAFGATIGGKWSVVVDGVEGKLYDAITMGWLTVSPDSRRIAYGANLGEKWSVVVDGVEGKQYDDIMELTFSPDSRRIAYGAKIGEKWVVVVDGVEGKPYDHLAKDWLTFSPDSRRIAFGVKVGEKWVVVVDGVERWRYADGRRTVSFSPNSKHVRVTRSSTGTKTTR